MFSTEDGRQIDLTDRHSENAALSIRLSSEFDSNTILWRETQKWKQEKWMGSTDLAMKSDLSDGYHMHAAFSI
jgi:hypothetical protein